MRRGPRRSRHRAGASCRCPRARESGGSGRRSTRCGPARDRHRARAPLRRRREPRAADAARGAQDRARARAPAASLDRRVEEALESAGDKSTADELAEACSCWPARTRRAARTGGRRSRPQSCSRRACALPRAQPQRVERWRSSAPRPLPHGRPSAARAGSGQPRRNALRHGDGRMRIEAVRTTARSSCASRTKAEDFRRRSSSSLRALRRADEARGGSSAGLGLSIVDAIARAHGGTASAVNVDGNGALVALTIPVESIESLMARHGLQA